MDNHQTIQLIHELGSQIGLPDLELDEDGACYLTFDDVLLCLQADEDFSHLTVYAPIVDLPAEGRETVLLELLGANFFWKGSAGATFAYSTGAEKVILQIRLALPSLTLPDLASALESFVNQCEHWTKHFQHHVVEEPRHEPSDFLMRTLV